MVNHFDEILDRYIYANESKEATYQKILCNRMGYGLLDVCKEDLRMVQKSIIDYEKKEEELIAIKKSILSEEDDLVNAPRYLDSLNGMLDSIDKTICLSRRLVNRASEILSMDPFMGNLDELNMVFKTNNSVLSKAESAQASVKEIYALLKTKLESFRNQRVKNSQERIEDINEKK